jgi:cell division protein FtsL
MLRFVNVCLVLGLVALAYVIYQVKYEARALDAEIASLNRKIDEERDAIAVLRAEWSLLNRPERIERLARKYLKLEPARPTQLVTLDTLSDRDFQPKPADLAPAPATVAQGTASKPAKPVVKAEAAPATGAASTATAPWPEAKIVRPVEASAQ